MSDAPTAGTTGFRVGPVSDPDRYVLGAAVASGAEGILYRGWLPTAMGFEVDVAVKMLQPRFLSQVEEWQSRWNDQVELLRSLQVPGVVRVRDGFTGPLPHAPGEAADSQTLYLVMNWVDGEPLDEWVRRRPERDPFAALKLVMSVAGALDLMHSGSATGGVSVVHRDVKPGNIMVTGDTAVLVDFGLTRGLPTGQRLTGVAGTPGYLAPEATEAGLYTPATDRYAFGGVAYFILTGKEPPAQHEPIALREGLAEVPALSQNPEAVAHLMAMLDDDPNARPEGLANWLGQLRRSSLAGLPDLLAPGAPRRHPGKGATGAESPRATPVAERTFGGLSPPSDDLHDGRLSTEHRHWIRAHLAKLVLLAGGVAAAVTATIGLWPRGSPPTDIGSPLETRPPLETTIRPVEPTTTTPPPTGANTAPIVFQDDFSTHGRWYLFDDERHSSTYADESYVMTAKSPRSLYMVHDAPMPKVSETTRVEVTELSTSPTSDLWFGVFCRRTYEDGRSGPSTSYLGTINTSGQWRISKFYTSDDQVVLAGGDTSVGQSTGQTEIVHTDSPNRIALDCIGGNAGGEEVTVRLEVNGQYAGSVKDRNGLGPGYVGLTAKSSGPAEVRFDDFLVRHTQ